MRTLSAALSLLLISSGAGAADSATSGKLCEMPMLATLPTVVQPAGKVSIPVSVAGRDVNLIVDTGGVISGITESTVVQLGLSRHAAPIQFEMMGNIDVKESARADSLRIGSLAVSGFDFLLLPDRAVDSNTSGLLGPDIMSNYDIEFDFAHARFNIFSPGHCSGNVIYWTKDGGAQIPMHVDEQWHVTLPVSLDGKNLTATIDSGAEHSTMNLSTARALFGLTPDDPRLKRIPSVYINGAASVSLYHYRFAALDLGGVTVNNPDIDILPDEAYSAENPQLLIGISVLRQLRIYIAYKEQMLYATPAEAQ